MKTEKLSIFAAGVLVGVVGAALLTCPEAKKAAAEACASVRSTGKSVGALIQAKVDLCKKRKAEATETEAPKAEATEAFTTEAEAPAEA